MPEAKAKVRARHERAIRDFQNWVAANPKVSKSRRMKMFDLLIDGVPLEEAMKKRKKNAAHV
jgi:hypothetical protein